MRGCFRRSAVEVVLGRLDGAQSEGDIVEAARAEKLAVLRKIEVWRTVKREACFQATGRPLIKLRVVDINKGDELSHK